MKAEDQFVIHEVEIHVTREGKGIVDSRHLKTKEDYQYYKVSGIEKRYVIVGPSGIKMMPHLIYENAVAGYFFFISGLFKSTRKYIREIDYTYFKYYDDAEEVLNNLIKFILWMKSYKPRGKKDVNAMKKYISLSMDVPDSQEIERIRQLNLGLNPKMRKNLSPLAKDLAEAKDLLVGRD
jgi:hypothetical protein